MTGAGVIDGRAQLLAAAASEIAEHGHAAVSLRAVARRAGLSHAAPGYFFQDRAGMLTAVAADGFTALADQLESAAANGSEGRLGALGRVYVGFGLRNPAVFDLMFSPRQLRAEDPTLRAAQRRAIDILSHAVEEGCSAAGVATTMAWAVAHGLVALTLQGALGQDGEVAEQVVERVLAEFASRTRLA